MARAGGTRGVSNHTKHPSILPHEDGLLVLYWAPTFLGLSLSLSFFLPLVALRHAVAHIALLPLLLLPISSIYTIRCNNTGSREARAQTTDIYIYIVRITRSLWEDVCMLTRVSFSSFVFPHSFSFLPLLSIISNEKSLANQTQSMKRKMNDLDKIETHVDRQARWIND